jgi:hypothetical protein
MRKRLSEIHPIFYHTRIKQKRLFRHLADLWKLTRFASERQVGEATADKGYIEGIQLSRGEVVRGVGGGLCQLANLLYWMALHTPLEIAERHHHSFDPFPDENRTLPFGSGAGVFYNYIDLRFYNPTDLTFQIKLNVAENHLKGAIYSETETPLSFHVFERNHRFLKQSEKIYRENDFDFEADDLDFDDELHDEIEGFEGYEELHSFQIEEVNMRTAVLSKNNMIALMCLKTAGKGGAICRVDPREERPSVQLYDDPSKALEWFVKSLRTSKENGWKIVYDGLPLRG